MAVNKNQLVPVGPGADNSQLPAIFGGYDDTEIQNLTAGLTTGHAVLSFRGKVWRVRYQSTEKDLLNDHGDPRPDFVCFILRASEYLSKTWYETQFESGSTEGPDCYSHHGVRPEPQSPKRQNHVCVGCRWNAFGTARTGKGKACADGRRLAVVPVSDVANVQYGGPMLLRVPPASLQNLRELADGLRAIQVPLAAAMVRLTFDGHAEYPEIKFQFLAYVRDPELAGQIIKLRDDPLTREIVHGPPSPAIREEDLPPPAHHDEAPTSTTAETGQSREPGTRTSGQAPRQARAAADDLDEILGTSTQTGGNGAEAPEAPPPTISQRATATARAPAPAPRSSGRAEAKATRAEPRQASKPPVAQMESEILDADAPVDAPGPALDVNAEDELDQLLAGLPG